MPLSHFCSSSRLLITNPKFSFLRTKQPLGYIKIFILLCLSVNTALAGEIFSTSFDSGTKTAGEKLQNGFYWKVGKNTTVSSENSKTGSYSLKFTFPGVADGKDSFSEQGFSLGGRYPDLWVKYDIYIPANYHHRDSSGPDNNKGFVVLWADGYSTADGREGPLLYPQFGPSSEGSKIYLHCAASQNGDITYQNEWTGSGEEAGRYTNAITNNDKGHWMTIVTHVKYATNADNDGIYEMWKTDWQGNTVKMMNVKNGSWYSTQPFSTLPARGFDQGYLLGWANSGFDKETILHIDNITFSTTPLSNDYVPDNTASPMPPTIISSN